MPNKGLLVKVICFSGEKARLRFGILELLANQNIEFEVRMAAAAYLKNDVIKSWNSSPEDTEGKCSTITPLRADDVTFLKDNLLEALVRIQDFRIQKVVVVCARTLCFNLFPENWDIIGQLEQSLSQNNQVVASCGLLILRKIVKRYQHVMNTTSARRPLFALEERLFPKLLLLADQILQVASQEGPHQLEAFSFVKIILQIYYSAVYSTLDEEVVIQQTIDPWMTLLAKVIELGIPENLIPADKSEVCKTPMSKCEKRALQIIYRFFKPGAALQDKFREVWEQKYAPYFAKACIQCLKKPHVAPFSKHLCYRYLALCFGKAITYQTIAPEFESLALGAFSLIHFNDEDETKWQEDPADYFRAAENNFCEFIFTTRYAAQDFFSHAAKFRAKDLLGPILVLCKSRLESGEPRHVDGALRILGELHQRLIHRDPKETEKAKLEGNGISVADLLNNYALPLFQSPHKFLRMRAAWMYLRFAETLKGGSMTQACEQIIRLTSDPELPVKAQACVTIKEFLARDDCRPMIQNHIAPLVRVLISVMVECVSDSIMETVQEIAVKYKEEIVPVAGELCKGLTSHVQNWIANDEGETMNMAVMASISTITTVVKISADDNPEYLSYLLPILADFLDLIISRRDDDYIDDVTDILAIFAGKMPPPLPAPLWAFFPKLMQTICGEDPSMWLQSAKMVRGPGFSLDYVAGAVPVFANFILQDPSFWTRSYQGHSYITLLRTTIERLVDSELDCPIMYVLCAMFRSCPEVHAKEFFTWATDFLWGMINDRRRLDDALFALCVILTINPAFVLEKVPVAHFVQAFQMSRELFRAQSQRAARVQAFACIARMQVPEVQAALPWIWETLRDDLEAMLEVQKNSLDDFEDLDGYSDHSQELDDHENAEHHDFLNDAALFANLDDDFNNDDNHLMYMLPIISVDDTLQAGATLMREHPDACSTKTWDVVKEQLQNRLLGTHGC
eukprot:GEMP01008421.1.p1 GENE.GEMP01008421.1~~GEMP01008421.1.p1  ORF type:complete len:967 (+),score=186.96 GEMP01008421.1:85-2985(+)